MICAHFVHVSVLETSIIVNVLDAYMLTDEVMRGIKMKKKEMFRMFRYDKEKFFFRENYNNKKIQSNVSAKS